MLITLQNLIGGIAFCGRFPDVPDEHNHLLFIHAITRTRCGYDVFFHHRAPQIIRAKEQRHLPDVASLRDPRALYVFEIIQIEAARG